MKLSIYHDNNETVEPNAWRQLLWNSVQIDTDAVYKGFDKPIKLAAGWYSVSIAVAILEAVSGPVELRLRNGSTPDFGGTGIASQFGESVVSVSGLLYLPAQAANLFSEIRHTQNGPITLTRIKDSGPWLRIVSLA